MIADVWVSRRTLHDSSIVYHCYIEDTDNTEQPFLGFYLTPDGIISYDDPLYERQSEKTKTHTYYSSYSVDSFEELIESYYDHKRDMIETVKQQFNLLLLSSIL